MGPYCTLLAQESSFSSTYNSINLGCVVIFQGYQHDRTQQFHHDTSVHVSNVFGHVLPPLPSLVLLLMTCLFSTVPFCFCVHAFVRLTVLVPKSEKLTVNLDYQLDGFRTIMSTPL